MFLKLAWQSLAHRRGSVLLAVLSVAVSLFVLLGVEQVRSQAKSSFNRTVSGVDLIAGARGGQLNLLLYSVFHIGGATRNISWDSYREIARHPRVAWTIPISLGDSHRGYRVVGTSREFFTRYRYGRGRPLAFAGGGPFAGLYDTVLGAEVAEQLGYRRGDSLVLTHGLGRAGFSDHGDRPFTAVGVLEPTGTPVDRALYVSLEAVEAIHRHWPGATDGPAAGDDLTPGSITAFMLGLDSRVAAFQVQRQINEFRGEPLMAILPGAALAELWQQLRGVENILLAISALVVLASLLGLGIMLLASMRERRREIALLRAVGAGPLYLFALVQAEALLVLLLGTGTAIAALGTALWLARPLAAQYGIYLDGLSQGGQTLAQLGAVLLGTLALGLVPSLGACRQSLHGELAREG
ncbi:MULTISPECIES: FtsX-like permease family protein [unclassified Microbulbifer]|uniref:ABC transporter permease n=1 Tax=unclassified Microbulbifer TaxID=2619833 RepID=UPI0027E3D570|nr:MULTISPECIES: FtsX-like permease family protein [unclassified Microbulbifer]